jgi:Flp pilus assembly protein protease CpaA
MSTQEYQLGIMLAPFLGAIIGLFLGFLGFVLNSLGRR